MKIMSHKMLRLIIVKESILGYFPLLLQLLLCILLLLLLILYRIDKLDWSILTKSNERRTDNEQRATRDT